MAGTSLQRLPNLMYEGRRILFRNFGGVAGRFNAEGERNFCVVIDPSEVDEMREQGWNIKTLAARSEDEDPLFYMKVKVNLRSHRPPTIVLVTSRGRTNVPEDLLSILDWCDIANVDMSINPSRWEMSDGKRGVTGYLKTIFITIEEDRIERKYADVPDYAMNSVGELEGGSAPLQITDGNGDEGEYVEFEEV